MPYRRRDDLAFTRRETACQRAVHGMVPVLLLNGRKTAVLAADNILQGKRIAVTVRLERVRERKLACTLRFCRKYISSSFWMHLEAYVASRIFLSALKVFTALISPIVPMDSRSSCSVPYSVILFYNMRYQSEIVLDQLFPCLGVPVLLHAAQQNRLLIGRERLGKRSVRALYTQHKEENAPPSANKAGKSMVSTSFR